MVKKWKSWNCHDCGVEEGQIHKYGCDMEECPFCHKQLLGCGCCEKKLGIDCSKGTWAYFHGITEEQGKQWVQIIEAKGRIPYLLIPSHCGLCGEQRPKDFIVPDKEWKKYVVPKLQDEVLCWECYQELKSIFPDGWKKIITKEKCKVVKGGI